MHSEGVLGNGAVTPWRNETLGKTDIFKRLHASSVAGLLTDLEHRFRKYEQTSNS